MDIVTSKDNKQLYFARNGVLYRYDMNKNQNKLYEVYRTFSKDADDIYTLNDESDIRINKLDENGNLYSIPEGTGIRWNTWFHECSQRSYLHINKCKADSKLK